MTSESSPLIENPSAGGSNAPSYYFLQQSDRTESLGVGDRSAHDADGGQVIDVLPDGATRDEFASRAVGTPLASRKMASNGSRGGSGPRGGGGGGGGGGFFRKLFGGGSRKAFEPQGTGVGSLVRERKVPIKIEPKVFFANERTFLAWLHVSIMLAGASIAIVAFADANPWSQLYGVLLLPVAIAFIGYAMFQYARRAAMIRRKAPGPYEDIVGPTVLGIMLMLSIVAQFSIKVYSMST